MTTNRVRRLPLAWHDKNHCLYSKNNELELAASFASRLNRKGRNSASRAETISWVLGLKPIYCSPKLWYGYYGHQDAPSKLLLFVSLNRRTPEVQPSHPCSLLVAALSLHWQIPHSSRAPEQPKKGKPIHGIHMNSCIVQGKTDEKRMIFLSWIDVEPLDWKDWKLRKYRVQSVEDNTCCKVHMLREIIHLSLHNVCILVLSCVASAMQKFLTSRLNAKKQRQSRVNWQCDQAATCCCPCCGFSCVSICWCSCSGWCCCCSAAPVTSRGWFLQIPNRWVL